MPIAAITKDLMSVSRYEGAVRAHGNEIRVFHSADQLESAAWQLVLLDLDALEGPVEEAVELIRRRAPGASLIAFGPHVRKDRLSAARQAGCDAVLSRGEFMQRAVEIIASPPKHDASDSA